MNFVHFKDGTHLNLDTVAHIEQVRDNDDYLCGVIISWRGVEGELGQEVAHSFFERDKAQIILRYLARHTVEE